MVEAAASAREPHRIAFYLADVAAAFHAWHNLGNDEPEARIVLANDPELTATRLYLADGIGQVVRNGLHLMGAEARAEMIRTDERRVGIAWVSTGRYRWSPVY